MQTDVIADIPRGASAGPREITMKPLAKKLRPKHCAVARAKRVARWRAANKSARRMRRLGRR